MGRYKRRKMTYYNPTGLKYAVRHSSWIGDVETGFSSKAKAKAYAKKKKGKVIILK